MFARIQTASSPSCSGFASIFPTVSAQPHTQEILPDLIDALNEKYGVTHNITYTLSSMGASVVPHLVDSINNGTQSVLENAVLCLVQMGPKNNLAAREVLKKLAAEEENEWIKSHALFALREQEEGVKGLLPLAITRRDISLLSYE
jgi:hypothetical protein